MNARRSILAFAMVMIISLPVFARTAQVGSPDGKISVEVTDDDNLPRYSISFLGNTIVEPSIFMLNIDGVGQAMKIKKCRVAKTKTEHIDAPFYRQHDFNVSYNSMTLTFDNGTKAEWRVFDDGAAYRFLTERNEREITVGGEVAEVIFTGNPTVYLPHSTNDANPMAMAFQNFYTVTPLSQASDRLAFLPVTADTGDGVKVTILESDLRSYPGMFVKADSATRSLSGIFARYPSATDFYPWRRQEYVTATEDYIARTDGTRSFPWRIFAITDDDRKMPVNNLVYALAEPSRLDDTSWIKPGKVAWDWWNDWGLRNVPFKAGINTETYKYYIDFASENGIEYVVLDEGWYDPKSGDMLTVIDDIDLPELIRYGGKKGVGIVLWTVFNVLDSQLDEACEKYADMGVAGFKVDFLDRDDQTAVEMTHRIAGACADHHLFLDYHGIYKSVGLNRTYPNVVNIEAVFGMEEVKWTDAANDMPRYDVTFPYIRLMAGPVDYTPGAMRNASKADWRAVYYSPMSMGTRAHQLSSYIIHDSPFTMLCDSPSNYKGEDECVDFITGLPVVFDSTEILDGKMGEYIVTARKKDDSWFIGGATDWTPRDITLDLSFLPADTRYKAVIIADGINADKQAQDYTRSETVVDRDTRLPVRLASGGGFAMRIDPIL